MATEENCENQSACSIDIDSSENNQEKIKEPNEYLSNEDKEHDLQKDEVTEEENINEDEVDCLKEVGTDVHVHLQEQTSISDNQSDTPQTLTAVDEYKNKHKIGSRKASESVISYSEPFFHSFVPPAMLENKTSPNNSPRKRLHSDVTQESKNSADGSQISPPKVQRTISVDSGIKQKSKPDDEKKVKKKSQKKEDILITPIAGRRTKREASLNAATFMNILYEKEPAKPRIKSQKPKPPPEENFATPTFAEKSTSSEILVPVINIETIPSSDSVEIPKNVKSTKSRLKPTSKPKQLAKHSKTKDKVVKKRKKSGEKSDTKHTSGSCKSGSNEKLKKKKSKDDLLKKKLKKINGDGKIEKRKRLQKAQKLLKTARTKQNPDKVKLKKKKDGKKEDEEKKKIRRMRKVDSYRSARTHVTVTPKRLYGSSWYDCCKAPYYAATSQGPIFWSNTDYIDRSTTSVTSVEVSESGSENTSLNPASGVDVSGHYTAPRMTTVVESPQYLMGHSHSHIPLCSVCGCGHGGMIATPSNCQTYTLGGVGSLSNMQVMPCRQPYGSACPITYPHSHGPYSVCGCTACFPGGTLHTSIHQPLTSDPLLLHHPVPVPVLHAEVAATSHPRTTSVQSDPDSVIDVGSCDDEVIHDLYPSVFETKAKPKIKRSISEQKPRVKKTEKSDKTEKKRTKSTTLEKIKKIKEDVNKIREEKRLKKKKEREAKDESVEKKKVKKSVSFHGWKFEGMPETRTMTRVIDGQSVQRKCYAAIRHDDGDIVQVRDCVLICSGPKKNDIPFVAKVSSFWEDPETEEVMMSLLWYYRPEHTEAGRKPHHLDCELFASKHRDETCVACIEDRGYVLTVNEYARYMAEVARTKQDLPHRNKVVPDTEEEYQTRRIPSTEVDPENVFLSRQVYDFKLKRVLKNPS